MNKTSCSQVKIRSPEHCLKLERWQGLQHINKVKEYETVLFLEVSLLFSLFSCEFCLHSAPVSESSEGTITMQIALFLLCTYYFLCFSLQCVTYLYIFMLKEVTVTTPIPLYSVTPCTCFQVPSLKHHEDL